MIKISKQNNSLIVEGIDNVFYPNNGDNSYPLNSLIVVTDNSDMATFRSVATNDVLFSGLIQNITINGEAVTKDNIIQKFDAVSNEGTVDAYTKEEADNKFASKAELTNVQTVANDADTKVDALTTRVESVETTLGNKQDVLVSGTNIKTINNQSILGEGNLEISGGVSEEQAQEIAKIPTLETELAQKANVSDVPTVQTNNTGTNKNYIYSNFASSDHKYNVISALANGSKSADKYSLLLRTWGPVSAYHNFDINAATTTAAGVMSAADKTKLDSIPENIPSQSEIDGIAANVSALETAMDGKQPTLVSGTNIKTINGNSILGEGNLVIEGGSSVDAYTKTESDAKYATKDELTAVETVANNADTKADAATSRIEGVETSLGNKQDTLVSGTNIKTINSQSILGSGDLTISGVSEEQAQEIAKIPTIETELAQKANVSDIPTVQTGSDGTNKNYIYSDVMSAYAGVISKVYPVSSADKINLRLYKWTTDTNQLSYSTEFLSKATTTSAGVMSAADKTKLDSIPENIPTQTEVDNIAANVSTLETNMMGKQDTLVSGTNIKTINNQSILGEGNIEVTIPDATTATSGAMSAADKTKLDSMLNEWTGTQAEYDALTTKEDNIIYYVTE